MHIYTHFDALAGDVLEDEWNGTGRVSNDTHRSLLDFNGFAIGGNHIGNSFTKSDANHVVRLELVFSIHLVDVNWTLA